MPTPISPIADVAALVLRRLPFVFRQDVNVQALAAGIGAVFQVIEDDAADLLTLRQLAVAEGAALDQYGAIVGEPREDLGDAEYRRFIAARILINNSSGSPDDLVMIAAALFGVTTSDVVYSECYPLTVILAVTVDALPVDATRDRLRRTLGIAQEPGALGATARPAGVALAVTLNTASPGAFRFNGAAGTGFNEGGFGAVLA